MNALNDQLLTELGTTWHGLEAIAFETLSESRRHALEERVRRVVDAEFAAGARPLIKDPRLARLLPLWQPVLTKAACRTVHLITLRNPIEVASSLAKRNELDAEHGYLLWARHQLDAEFHTRGLPRALVAYDDLVDDWRTTIGALAPWGISIGAASEVEVDDFLSAQLRHHRTAPEQVAIELERFPLVYRIYRAMTEWQANGAGSEPDHHALDEAREEFDRIGGMLTTVVEKARADRKRLVSARSKVESLTAEVQQARRAADDLKALEAAHAKQEELSRRISDELDEVRKAQAQMEEGLKSAVASLSEAIQERAALEASLMQARKEADEARSELSRTEAAARQAAEEHDRLVRELKRTASEDHDRAVGELKKASEDHGRAVAELEGKLAAADAERSSLGTELKDVKRKYRSTQHQLSRDQERLRKAQERIAQLDATLQQMQQSGVWRAYSAVRGGRARAAAALRRLVGGSPRKRLAGKAELLRNSPLFDAAWYLVRYPDVASAGTDPAVHYLENGWKEGRDPSASFSTSAYLRLNGDVAAAGLNPLLHYIEFGYSEGRSVSGGSSAPPLAASVANDDFTPAAPCFTMPVQDREPVRWQRAFQLAQSGDEVLAIAGLPIGLVRDAAQKAELQAAFAYLRALSGGEGELSAGGDGERDGSDNLVDAWYVNANRLRTRWQVGAPTVIRAYQSGAAADGGLLLAGEGLILSDLDLVDNTLANPFFPLLFVLSDPDGTIRSVEFLAFPSLCRGGSHYPELLAIDVDQHPADGPTDVAAASGILARRLGALILDRKSSFVAKIRVDLSGADGAEALFQPEFQRWLWSVMRVSIEPASGAPQNSPTEFVGVPSRVRRGGCTLVLAADMIPTIGLLSSRTASAKGSVEMSLLIGGDDPAQPAMLVRLPAAAIAAPAALGSDYPASWPRLEGAQCNLPAEPLAAMAIRHPRRGLPNDSELLVPVAPPALKLPSAQAITWLIFPEDWDDEVLAQALQGLALQQGSEVALIGDVRPDAVSLAPLSRKDRVNHFATEQAALEGIQTALVGYLGPHVVLHDARTSQLLATLVDAGAVSASCVLLSSERRGKGWTVSVADPGAFTTGGQRAAPPSEQAQRFWRTTYPLARPPRDLWVAKRTSVLGWLERGGPLRPEEGLQLCTSLITASYIGQPRDGQPHIRPPAADGQTIRTEMLFG